MVPCLPPGASLYGVADLTSLANDTHKFESRYIDQLVAPSESMEIWSERSPINHTDSFNCPIVLFQGDEDKVGVSNGMRIRWVFPRG